MQRTKRKSTGDSGLERVRKLQGHGPRKITISIAPPRSVSNPQRGKQPSVDREKQTDRNLAPFFAVGEKIIKKLEPLAKQYRLLGENGAIPSWMVEELRQKMILGLAVWAIDKMGVDFKKYMEDGRANFIDKLIVVLYNPFRDEFRNAKHFMEAFEKAGFLIPRKPGRRMVHHQEWTTLWAEYNRPLEQAQTIKDKKWRNPIALEMKLIETFPGMINKGNAATYAKIKPSDMAISYVNWKFKTGVGIESLKKDFKVFHKPYGYYDFVCSTWQK